MTQTMVVEPKYYGAHGTLGGHTSGLYIIEATSLSAARGKLYDKWKGPREAQPTETLQEIRDEWAKTLGNCIEQIQNKETEYYVDLGNGVYYFEI